VARTVNIFIKSYNLNSNDAVSAGEKHMDTSHELDKKSYRTIPTAGDSSGNSSSAVQVISQKKKKT